MFFMDYVQEIFLRKQIQKKAKDKMEVNKN